MEVLNQAEFWVLIAFLIAVGTLAYKAWPMIRDRLDSRAAKIKADLDEAARLREEAQRVLADYQRKQRDALKSAEEIVAHARAEAERVAQQAMRDLDAAIERRQVQAAERIALAEQKATAEVRNAAIDIAVAAVRRMLADDLDAAHKSALIDIAIADLPRQLN
jgi:F-type H+-transporting ATPase subunit b